MQSCHSELVRVPHLLHLERSPHLRLFHLELYRAIGLGVLYGLLGLNPGQLELSLTSHLLSFCNLGELVNTRLFGSSRTSLLRHGGWGRGSRVSCGLFGSDWRG